MVVCSKGNSLFRTDDCVDKRVKEQEEREKENRLEKKHRGRVQTFSCFQNIACILKGRVLPVVKRYASFVM